MDEAETRNQLKDWLLEHSQAPMEKAALTDELPILEVGLLNSLDIVEFVLYIEELRDEEVDTDEIEPEVFTSINTLWAGFFATLAG